jgi:hypothetical protein
VSHLLASQVQFLGGKFLQQVFGRHWLPLQVPPNSVL